MNGWGGRAAQRLTAATLQTYGTVCHLCEYPGATSADHVIPRALGGPDVLTNLRPAHLVCNQRRNDRALTPELRAELRARWEADAQLLAAEPDVSPRFAGRRSSSRPAGQRPVLHVVTGPPCGGKTTHVHQHRQPDDVVLDVDALAHALGYPASHITYPHPAADAAALARRAVLDAHQSGQLRGDLWLIEMRPHPTSLRIYERAGAHVVAVDPGLAVCLARADDRPDPAATRREVTRFFESRPHP